MNFLNRLLGRNYEVPVRKHIDENELKDILVEAKRKNKEASDKLAATVGRQTRDAELVRQVIDDMLRRADKRKVRKTGGTI